MVGSRRASIFFLSLGQGIPTHYDKTNFTHDREVIKKKKSIENIPYNLNEVRGDNKECILIRITQLSKFSLQQYVILHFELFLNRLLSCLR